MKTKILSVLVAIAILTLGIGTTAVAAPLKPPVMEFQLTASASRASVGWVGDSTVLADNAEVTWRSWGNEYKVFIAQGTEVIGFAGQQIYFLEVAVNRYPSYIYLNPMYLGFSRPVTISQLVDGNWTTIATFTTILGGVYY